jgi:hypothetical protein
LRYWGALPVDAFESRLAGAVAYPGAAVQGEGRDISISAEKEFASVWI